MLIFWHISDILRRFQYKIMKFLRNTASDFFAHSTRFIFNETVDVDDCGCDEAKQEHETIKQEHRSELTKLANECIPKTGLWSTKTQNERAETMTVNNEGKHLVSYGDTLGSIVKGITGRLDYSRPVLYRSKKLTPARREAWNAKTGDCFPVPPTLGQEPETAFKLNVVNLIYPGQVVYIQEINGVKYVVVDDGESVPGSGPIVPLGPRSKPKQKPCILPQDQDINPCDEHTASQIWNGIEGGDPAAMKLLEKMSGGVIENQEAAREAYLTLYGRKEWKGVEKDGIYIVMEKYFNPKMKGGVFGMVRRLVSDDSLATDLEKAGYSGDEIAKLMAGLSGASTALDTIEGNAGNFSQNLPKELQHQDAGVVKDFLLRLGAGAIVGTAVAAAFAFPPGWAIPALLGGAALVQFKGGVKRFNQYPDVNSVYATLTKTGATSKEIIDLIGADSDCGVGVEAPSALDTYRNAALSVDMQNFLAHDALDSDVVLRAGPNPDWNQIRKQNLMSGADIARYKEQAENGKEVETRTGALLRELALNGYYYSEGAALEGDQSRKAKEFKLKGKDKRAFKNSLDDATRSFNPITKKEKYTEAMSYLVGQLNESAQDMLDVVWKPELTMEALDKAFKHGHEFYLGALPQGKKSDLRRELYVKFTPDKTAQAKNTGAAGTWEMYIKEDGQVAESTRLDYRAAQGFMGKKAKKFTVEDLQALNYDPEQKFNDKEIKDLLDRLNTFDLIAGQLAQINEAKDQMTVAMWNEERTQETARIKNQFKVEMRDDGTRTETQGEYQYRISVASKLAKFETWEKFEKHLGCHFDKGIQILIKKVYNKEPGSINILVQDKCFQYQMGCVTRGMQMCEGYLTINDLNACSSYVKDNMYLSGQAAGAVSKYHTVTFGDVYLGYLVAEGLVSTTITTTIKEWHWHDFETGLAGIAKNESGVPEGMVSIEVTEDIVNTVRQWQIDGWLTNAVRRAIIAASGGRVTNKIIDSWANSNSNEVEADGGHTL